PVGGHPGAADEDRGWRDRGGDRGAVEAAARGLRTDPRPVPALPVTEARRPAPARPPPSARFPGPPPVFGASFLRERAGRATPVAPGPALERPGEARGAARVPEVLHRPLGVLVGVRIPAAVAAVPLRQVVHPHGERRTLAEVLIVERAVRPAAVPARPLDPGSSPRAAGRAAPRLPVPGSVPATPPIPRPRHGSPPRFACSLHGGARTVRPPPPATLRPAPPAPSE